MAGDFDIVHFRIGPSLDDPSDHYTNQLHSQGRQNWAKYSNPRVDTMLDAQDAELDPAQRREILLDLQRVQLEEVPWFSLLWQHGHSATHPEVQGYVAGPLGVHPGLRLDRVWLSG